MNDHVCTIACEGCDYECCAAILRRPVSIPTLPRTDSGSFELADHRLHSSKLKQDKRSDARLALAFLAAEPVYGTTVQPTEQAPVKVTFAAQQSARKRKYQQGITLSPRTIIHEFLTRDATRRSQTEPLWMDIQIPQSSFRWQHVGYRTKRDGTRGNIWQVERSRRYIAHTENEQLDTDEPWLAQATRRYEALEADVESGFVTEPGRRMERIFADTGITWAESKTEGVTTVRTWDVLQGRSDLDYFLRDDIEIAREKRIAVETDSPLKVRGDHWVGTTRQRSKGVRTGNVTLHTTGAIAEKAWLDATISQLRINYRELARDAMAKTGKSNVSGFAQLIAIQRQAASLRHRHNYRRFVEALGTDPARDDQHEAFNEAYAKAETWRKSKGLSYEQAARRMQQRVTKITDRWVGVEGLIAIR